MSNDITQQYVVFSSLSGKLVIAAFDCPQGSSDVGVVLLKTCDERLAGLSAR